jgi:O-antigen/teichoic acid export membrane protein
MINLKTQTITGISWSALSQIVKQILSFIISVILARILSPGDFGLIGMVLVFTGFAQIFSEFGLGTALIQKQDLKENHLSSIFWINILIGIIITIFMILISPLLASFYHQYILKQIIIFIAPVFFISSVSIVQYSLFQKNLNFKTIAVIDLLSILLSGIIAVILAFSSYGIWSLVWQSLFFAFFQSFFSWIFSSWHPKLSFDIKALKELMNFSLNMLGFNTINYWARNLDNMLIGKYLGDGALGIYSRAYSLMMLPIIQISSVVSRVMFPALSSMQNDIEKIKKTYLKTIRSISLVTFPLMIGLMVMAKPFILSIYGEKWAGVIPILQVFCLIGMLQSIFTTVSLIYTSLGRADIMFKWSIFASFFIILSFIVGLQWGVMGVAYSYFFCIFFILWYPGWSIPGKLINLSFGEYLKNLSGTFFCSIAMGSITWFTGKLLPATWNSWSFLAIQSIACCLSYFILINIFKIKAYFDLLNIVKIYLSKK